MATILLADVERIESPGVDIGDVLRIKQTGFESDGDFKMVHRYADGSYKYWNPTDVGGDHTILTNLNSTDYQHLTSAQYNTLTLSGIADSLHHHTNLYNSSNVLMVQVGTDQVGINGNPISECTLTVTSTSANQLCLYNNSWYYNKFKCGSSGHLFIEVVGDIFEYSIGKNKIHALIGDSNAQSNDSNISYRLGINSSSACTYKGNFSYDETTNKVSLGYGTSANMNITTDGNVEIIKDIYTSAFTTWTITLSAQTSGVVPTFDTTTRSFKKIGNFVLATFTLNHDGGTDGSGTGDIMVKLPANYKAIGSNIFTLGQGYVCFQVNGSTYYNVYFEATETSYAKIFCPQLGRNLICSDFPNGYRRISGVLTYEAA